MNALIEVVAGTGYLLQKIFLYLVQKRKKKEGKEESLKTARYRVTAWVSYIIGLPMWLIVFVVEDNWMLVFVEGGGFPSMLLGLILAFIAYQRKTEGVLPRWIRWAEKPVTFLERKRVALDNFALLSAIIGVAYSIWLFGGMTQNTQWMELCVVIGYLAGTYLLAKERWTGWAWYLLMNGSNAILMTVQARYLLAGQQIVSIVFVLLALKGALSKKE